MSCRVSDLAPYANGRLLKKPSILPATILATLLFAGKPALCAQPNATTTVLSLSQTAINPGSVVLLTATVVAVNGPVAAGQVQFLNGKLTLGSVQGVAQEDGSLVAMLPTWSFVCWETWR